MVNKIKAYKTNSGLIFTDEEISQIDVYKTSDGKLFDNELEAYKYETAYLESTVSRPVVNYGERINKVNGITIEESIKQYPIAELIATSCESIPSVPGIYMWYNVFEKSSYSGSASNLRNRVTSFVNINNKAYAGKKVNEIREKYSKVHNLAWVLFILEENVEESLLLERENFYINKFDLIGSGYNTVHPVVVVDNNRVDPYKIAEARYPFSSLVGRIEGWGYKVGDSITIDEFAKYFRSKTTREAAGHDPNSRFLSFRVNAVIHKKDTIEFCDLIFLPRKFIDFVDRGLKAFGKKDGEYPSIIKYRKYDDVYIPYCNSTLSFKSPIDAVNYCIELKRSTLLSLITPEEFGEVYYFMKNMTVDDFIDLCYHDAEKLKNFIREKVFTEEDASEACGCYNRMSSKIIDKHYNNLVTNIESFGLKCSENLTVENYGCMFPCQDFSKRDTDEYLSFRLPTYINGKNTVGIEDLVVLPYGISKHLDVIKVWSMKDSLVGHIPDFMSYNRVSGYTAVGLCGKYHNTIKDALCAYLDLILKKFEILLANDGYEWEHINYEIDEVCKDKILCMTREELVRICFYNPEPLIEILNS